MTPTGFRKLLSSLFVAFCAGAVLLALIPLALILFFVISRGILSLNLAFFTHMPTPVGEAGGGMANSIVGTLMLSGLAALMAVPIGVISGIYMSEYAGTRFAAAVRFAADTLNGVPSIVIGLFAYVVAVLPFQQFSAFAGGFALGLMMIPIIARTTEELLLLVPGTMREGALALAHPGACRVQRGPAGGAARDCDRRRAGAGSNRRRDGAAVVHRVQQPVLLDQPEATDLVADGAGLYLRDRPLRGLASSGVGRRARARLDRADLFAPCPSCHSPPRAHACTRLNTDLDSLGHTPIQ
jgi:ABC-type phosphate transport system, permease component